jgi:hypothetical protein
MVVYYENCLGHSPVLFTIALAESHLATNSKGVILSLSCPLLVDSINIAQRLAPRRRAGVFS